MKLLGETVKTISLNFNVPADQDTPSEVLNLVKTLLLNALSDQLERGYFDRPCDADEKALAQALLTES